MTTPDLELDRRLAALEAHVPVDAAPPALVEADAHGPRRSLLALLAAPVLALAVGASAIAGVAVSGLIAIGHPGVENPGQPLYGANLECMTPPQAAAYLEAHGFADVVWQVETTGKDPSGSSAPRSPALVDTPPAHGYVVPGSIVDGRLHMVVDQRAGATGTGACAYMPMP